MYLRKQVRGILHAIIRRIRLGKRVAYFDKAQAITAQHQRVNGVAQGSVPKVIRPKIYQL